MRSRRRILDICRGGLYDRLGHRYMPMSLPSRTARSAFLLPSPLTTSIRSYSQPIDTSASPNQSPITHPVSEVSTTNYDSARAAKLRTAQEIINYKFQNEDLLWEALQAAGSNVSELHGHFLSEGNKKLASLGDSVIALVVKHHGYIKYNDVGYTSALLNKIANNTRFSGLCDEAGLTACVNVNLSQGNDVPPRTRADTIEAVIGAVYHDGGMEKAKQVIKTLKVIDADI